MTLTKNNQLKSKDRASRQYPIDFVVPLQLEECIHRIDHCFDQSTNIHALVAHQLDANTAEFILREYDEQAQQFTMRIHGTLYRWEGVTTRFKGNFQMLVKKTLPLPLWLTVISQLTYMVGCLLWIMAIRTITSEITPRRIIFIGGLLVSWVVLIGLSSRMYDLTLKRHVQGTLIKTFVERLLEATSSTEVKSQDVIS